MQQTGLARQGVASNDKRIKKKCTDTANGFGTSRVSNKAVMPPSKAFE
jgi:hypothetical protein